MTRYRQYGRARRGSRDNQPRRHGRRRDHGGPTRHRHRIPSTTTMPPLAATDAHAISVGHEEPLRLVNDFEITMAAPDFNRTTAVGVIRTGLARNRYLPPDAALDVALG